ncbi:unnamed protein product [Prorocentrum cordatum]|uniref:Uncharacterized protein n=1 Tax=Prorocentrum cordatum TaxID=2364126 RepID=A0ABN9WSS2_9DINO|nr:unnamed protein product [Polarella glacialis]
MATVPGAWSWGSGGRLRGASGGVLRKPKSASTNASNIAIPKLANKKGAKAGKTAEGRRGGLRNGKADAAASEHLVLEPGSLVALLVLEPAQKKCWAAPRTNILRRKQPQRGSPAPLPRGAQCTKRDRRPALHMTA